MMSLIMNQMSDKDINIIFHIRKIDEMMKNFKRKYENKRFFKIAQNVKKLFSYQFEKNEIIIQV